MATVPPKKAEATASSAGGASVADATIELVNHLILEAARMNASDIHIEPGTKEAIVRYRVDGVLQVRRRFPLDQIPQVVSRVKIMSRLDVTEHRMPLDGRVGFGRPSPNEPYIDLRVSTVPLLSGEKVCMRLIYKDRERADLEHMGLSAENLETYRQMVDSPSGLLIHVGPAGSGKTSSVYAAIQHLNEPGRNISTVEDPIEYELDGVNQAQVNPDQGLTFGVVLRAYMRQDCNVILVGEIRDSETCEIAIQAALTGHMILGTLHAESCIGAIARLQELGISNYFIGSAIKGIVSQRLVRRLCEKCKRAVPPPQRLADALGLQLGQPIQSAVGCKACGRGGYKGRFAIHEVMCPDEETRDRIYRGAAPSAIEEAALEAGMAPLWLDGFEKVAKGETTLSEILRVVRGVTMGTRARGDDPLGGIVDTLVSPGSPGMQRGPESL
ncbi:type II/IV secretion system protein [bacterium]|nr:type II/IV secretion system protein [bacterium]